MKNSWIWKCVYVLALLLSLGVENDAAEEAAKTRKVVVGAGCFWCLEAVYEHFPGVVGAVSGYAGGSTKNPGYRDVGSGKTGHAEVVEIEYDPARISYEKLLEILWNSHDPTDSRGVAPDFGSQYRSVILFKTPEEKATAEKAKTILEKKLGKRVVTEIAPLDVFYPAEGYHQDYVKKNPTNSYVRQVSLPRVKETVEKEKASEK
jgi:peptide-methionine (S)-S-oxide reductase